MEAPMDRRYERLQQGAAMATYDTAFLSNLAQGMGTLFSNVTLVAVVSAGALLVVGGELSVGGLAACTLLAGRIIQPMLRAAGLATQLESVLIASDRAAEIFETPSEADDRTVDLLEITGAVEFRNVSYRYDGDDKDVLRNVNLNIRAGEMIAISGEVGSGKSTLLSLLMRMAVPTEGEILFDGISTDQLDPLRLREQIAYLSQSPLVVSGTIMENLTLFRKGDAIDEAMKAGRLIGLDQVVNRLPRGYDTLIGAGAERKLPVGVLQSIANARALAGSRPVIIFDSGETGLDSLSNQKLHNAFATLKGTATIIIVSFRPSLTKLADRHFELRDGELHEVTLTSDAEAIGPGESKPPQPKTSPSNRLGLGLATGSGGAQ
jgi:ATP-binding cassette subfamily C protein LapB